ncbi:ribosomal protein S5 domain 2-type protein [Umbelopsis sp. PMI_123]|nr:ribosomal protein S5 domain 2-type protein [Umbelopsis sp. PMI_123]
MSNDREAQEEEALVLQSIYDKDFIIDETSPSTYHFTLRIDEETENLRSPRLVVIDFHIPEAYPSSAMPVYEITSVYCGTQKIEPSVRQEIDDTLKSMFVPGEVVLFEWINWLKEYLDTTYTKAEQPEELQAEANEPVEQVQAVRRKLLQNKKIAKATHNILAYRIELESGVMAQDHDEDGETAAGGRLLHLLQILEVTNVVVIVSRWYGGVLLHADRFKDINNSARQVLETYGYLDDTKGKKK